MVFGEQAIVNQLCKIHDEMKQLRMLSKAVEDRTIDVYFVTIPEEGGSREFAVGTTKIDFKTGLITNPNGSVEELSRKLDLVQDKDVMHSISIHSNQNIKFRLNSSGQQSVNADFLFQLPYVTYTVLEITCTEISAINIFACTNPQATLGNFKVTTISTIEQESVSGDTTETQAWDSVTSLKNNLNRIRHQIIAITGESWGTVSNSIVSLFSTTSGHDHNGTNSKKVDAGDVVNTPAGDIVTTDVQAAMNELDTKKETPAAAQAKVNNHADDISTHGVAEVADKETVSTEIDNDISTHGATSTNIHGVTETILGTEDKDVANGIAGLDASGDVIKEPASKGAANGVAPLDASMEVPISNMKTGGANELLLTNSNVEIIDLDVMTQKYLSIALAVV